MTGKIEEQRDAFVGRLFQMGLSTMDAYTVYLGDRLGLYRGLADLGAATSTELAERTGTSERHVREWLEQQAVTGILEVEDDGAQAMDRRYRLPAGHVEPLLDRNSPNYLAPLFRSMAAVGPVLPALLDAFRMGGGVPYAAYGADVREAQADMNRPHFLSFLTSDWLPAMPDIHARLQSDPPARVADVGCGAGWSSIEIARAYPKVRVEGFDSDAASVELARSNATKSGVADRAIFHLQDASEIISPRPFDLVLAFEAIHDMARPVEALRTMRNLAGDRGSVIVVDERVGERFTAPGDDLERVFYGNSVLFCLPNGMAETPSAATGAVMRPDTFKHYAVEAGFREVEILPIEHDFWRFYRLHG